MTTPKVLILSDGKAGHNAQSIGIAEACDWDYELIELKQTPWGKLLEWLYVPWAWHHLPHKTDADICIATGHHLALVNRWIKRKNPKLFTVQVMPRGGAWYYSAAIALAHDTPEPASNLLIALAAPNRISKNSIADALTPSLIKQFVSLPAKKIGVLIGGTNKNIKLDVVAAETLAEKLVTFAKGQGAGLIVSTSRRTGEEQTQIIKNILEKNHVPHTFYSGDGENPYPAMLGMCEAVIVTADSFSMVSEVATAGVPVLLYGPSEGWNVGKFKLFYRALRDQKRLMDVQKVIEGAPITIVAEGLDENDRIRDFLFKRLEK